MPFQIGTRVQGGKGEDHDTGTVVEDDGGDVGTLYDPTNQGGTVLVAWDSGVAAWSPVDLLSLA